jgi:hypothetical protein
LLSPPHFMPIGGGESVKPRFHRPINPKLMSALFPIRVCPPRTLLAW